MHQQNYEHAEREAVERLCSLNPEEQATISGATLKASVSREFRIFELPYFNKRLVVPLPKGRWFFMDDNRLLTIWERILVLHYLGHRPASLQDPRDHEPIGFAQVPSGKFYLDAFSRDAERPLAKAFGSRPGQLYQVGESLGAENIPYGDAAVRIPVFPYLSVIAVIHAKDVEFEADAKLLFDPSVISIFCTEDIAVLGNIVRERLIWEQKRLDDTG